MATGSGPSIQVKIGADVTGLKKDLGAAQKLVDSAGASMETRARRSATEQKALNKEIQAGNQLLGQTVSVINTADKAAVEMARDAIRAQKEWMDSVGATTQQYVKLAGVEKQLESAVMATQKAANAQANLGRVTDATTGQLTSFGRRGATAFTAVLFGAEQLFEGTESGARSALRAVSTFAFAFGPEGIIISALSTGALALMHYFDQAEERMKKAAATFRAELGGMSNNELGARTLSNQGQLNAFLAEKGAVEGRIAKAGPVRYEDRGDRGGFVKIDPAAQDRARLKVVNDNINRLTDRLVAIGEAFQKQNPFREEKPRRLTAEERRRVTPLATAPTIQTTGSNELRNIDYTTMGLYGQGTKMPNIGRSIKPMFDPKMTASMDAVAAAESRRAAREEVLIGALGTLSGAVANAAMSFVSQKLGKAGGIGGLVGGGLVGALGGSVGKALGGGYGKIVGSIAGSIIPGAGTIVGGLVGAGLGKVFGGLFGRHKKNVDKSADSLAKMSEAAKKATEELTNMPTGFKVALYRQRYANPNNAPGGGSSGGEGGTINTSDPGYVDPTSGLPREDSSRRMGNVMAGGGVSGNIVFNGPITVLANDPSEFYKKMGDTALQQSKRGGVSSLAVALQRQQVAA